MRGVDIENVRNYRLTIFLYFISFLEKFINLKTISRMSKMECVTVQEGFYLVTISWLGAGCLWFCWLLRAVRSFGQICYLLYVMWSVIDNEILYIQYIQVFIPNGSLIKVIPGHVITIWSNFWFLNSIFHLKVFKSGSRVVPGRLIIFCLIHCIL